MNAEIKYYIVAAEALPEVFLKVAEAKRMLQTGEADTVGEATRLAGISRSAFYKYKDAVQPFNDMKTGHVITFYAMLKNNPALDLGSITSDAASGNLEAAKEKLNGVLASKEAKDLLKQLESQL